MMSSISDNIKRSAVFSDCRTWRYTLERYWDKSKPFVLFILLNPSTADEVNDDRTNTRGINYAKDWGYGGVVFCNLFAYRTPKPAVLKEQGILDVVGSGNKYYVLNMCENASMIICAWGTHGSFINQDQKMLKELKQFNLYHMGLTKHGFPRHILYLKGSIKPQLWKNLMEI